MPGTYYNHSAEEALSQTGSSLHGLTQGQVEKAREAHGPNLLAETKKKSLLLIFLEQFKDLLVLILIVAAVISLISGQGESSIVIFAVILLNAVLGTVQYVKAENPWKASRPSPPPALK